MTKEEMKNRISLALKDPMLQQGFEIICKGNAELKERNAELKGMYAHSAREAGTYKQFLELKEKENAELKKQQFSLRNERNTFLAQNEQYEKDLIDFNENLTRAKEIILKLYNAGRDVLMCRAEEKAYDKLSEAINDRSIERFLKEIEK